MITKKKSNTALLPDSTLRVCTVLRSRAVRDEIAALAKTGSWSHHPELNASAARIADHLSAARVESADVEFFDTRRFSEAIILQKTRPVLLVKDGVFETAPLSETEKQLSAMNEQLIRQIEALTGE